MNSFLLDSNILIYLFARNEKVDDFINNLCADEFAISSISYLEILVGAEKSGGKIREVENFLEEVHVIEFNKKTVNMAMSLNKTNQGKLKFKDLAIAATALVHKLPLVTADHDFKFIKDLEVKYVKINMTD